MHSQTESAAGALRQKAEPSGWTDLNEVVPQLMAPAAGRGLVFRCDALPLARGSQEDWTQLLQALLQPLLDPASGSGRRYVHIQCSEDLGSREQHYRLSLQGSTPTRSPADTSVPVTVGALCERLGIRLDQPARNGSQPHIILQFSGKQS